MTPMRRRFSLIHAGLVMALAVASQIALAEVKPLPRSQWPQTLEKAVPLVLAAMNPAQKSIVKGTPLENLFMLQGEWGEDIERLLGLNAGNTVLLNAVCGKRCGADQAVIILMEAAWKAARAEP